MHAEIYTDMDKRKVLLIIGYGSPNEGGDLGILLL